MERQQEINTVNTVWLWKQQKQSSKCERATRRKRSVIIFCCMFLVSLFAFFILNHIILAAIIWFLSILTLVSGFFIPPVYIIFDKISRFSAFLVGTLLTYLLLVPCYYICFFPGHIILKLLGRDPMTRRFDKTAKTYWQNWKHSENINCYKVQYK